MKPNIKIKLFRDNDKVAEIETELITKVYKLLSMCEFDTGVVRVTYKEDMYNEASFQNATQCKILVSVFKEKPLLKYIYDRDL